MQRFTAEILALFDFYRHGAALRPPQRGADRSRWYDRVIVGLHVVASACVAKVIVSGAAASWSFALTSALFVSLGHKAVDPAHGLVHFVIDNYFRRTTPVIGEVVDGFLNHHDRPAMIARIQLARNNAPLMMLSLPVLGWLVLARPMATPGDVALASCLGTFFVEIGFSMEAHKYAHMSPKALPATLQWLQRRGWLISVEEHAKHHARSPGFEADYAAVTGKANRYLTPAFLRRTERAIYQMSKRLTGEAIEPRSWKDPAVRQAAFPEVDAAQIRARDGLLA